MLIVSLIVSNNCYAYYDYTVDNLSVEEAQKNPKYWHQGTVPADTETLGSSGKSMGRAACGYFATSCVLVKMGKMDPTKENPRDLVKWAKTNDGIDSGGWHLNMAKIGKYKEGVKTWTGNGGYFNQEVAGKSGSTLVTWVKGKMKEGWFVILCMGRAGGGAHYICVDGFNDKGEMIIADSAYNPTKEPKKFNQAGSYGSHGNYYDCPLSYAVLYKLDGCDPLKAPSIYGDEFKCSSAGASLSKEEEDLYNALVQEYELKGMPAKSEIPTMQTEIDLVGQEDLSFSERNNIKEIKSNIDGRHITVLDVVNIIISFLGIVLCTYAVVLFVGGIGDLSNNWIEISIVSRLTMGRCRVLSSNDVNDLKVKKGDYSIKQWAFICLTIFVIGIILVSGVIQKIVLLLLNLIQSR